MKSKPRPWPGVRFGWPRWGEAGGLYARDRDHLAMTLPSRDYYDEDATHEDMLMEAIEQAQYLRRHLDDMIEEMVFEARYLGTSWSKIAESFDVRATAVQKRFGPREQVVLERVTEARDRLERRARGEKAGGQEPFPETELRDVASYRPFSSKTRCLPTRTRR